MRLRSSIGRGVTYLPSVLGLSTVLSIQSLKAILEVESCRWCRPCSAEGVGEAPEVTACRVKIRSKALAVLQAKLEL